MNRILVLGGTGFVGRAVCERLAERCADGAIVVPTRRLPRGDSVKLLPTVSLVAADINDANTLTRLVQGCDAVINLVAILHGSRVHFERVHVGLPQKLIKACRSAAVRRIVHVSALGAAADAPSHYLRSKAAGEALLAGSGLDVTVLRPSVIFGAQDRFTNLFAQLQSLAPCVPLAGSAALFQPVWVEDVAAGIVAVLDAPASIGKVYQCTGPQVFSLSELVRLAGRWSGHERPQIALPAWAGRLQAGLMGLLPGPPLISRDNLDSMRVPNVASAELPGLQALGITPAALQAVVPGYLSELFQRADLDRWRAGAGRA